MYVLVYQTTHDKIRC